MNRVLRENFSVCVELALPFLPKSLSLPTKIACKHNSPRFLPKSVNRKPMFTNSVYITFSILVLRIITDGYLFGLTALCLLCTHNFYILVCTVGDIGIFCDHSVILLLHYGASNMNIVL